MSAESLENENPKMSVGDVVSLLFKVALAAMALQFMVAWWRRYGGWVAVTPSSGMYAPSLPPWMMALIGDLFLLAPSLIGGVVGWFFAFWVAMARVKYKTPWVERLGNAVLTFAAVWTGLLFVMFVTGTRVLPMGIGFPL
jgi:hypothetical protein